MNDPVGTTQTLLAEISLLKRKIEESEAARAALAASEQRYRRIAEGTVDLISILDMNLRFTYVSSASMRLRGFTVEEAMAQRIEEVLTPDSLKRCMAMFDGEMALEASGTADPNRTRILEVEEYKKGGSVIWVEVSFSFLRDREGRPVEILMVSRDITDRRRAQEAMAKSEGRLLQAQAVARLGSWEIDLARRTLWGSEEAFRIYGIEYPGPGSAFLPLDEVQKRVHPGDRPMMDQALRTLLEQKEPYDREFRIFRKSDSALRLIHSRADLYVSDSGAPLKVFGTILDITDRRQAEERLAQEQAQLFSIFDQMPAEVSVIDPGTYRLLYLNRYAQELYGLDSAGRPCYEVFYGYQGPCRICNNELLLARGDSTAIHREVFSERVGRHFLTTNSLMRWPDGRRVKLEIAIDITDRKRAEEEERRSREKAERLAKELSVIAEIGRIVSSSLDIEKVYGRFAEAAARLIAFDRIVVNLNDPEQGVISVSYSAGLDVPGRRPGERYPLAGSVNEALMAARRGLLSRMDGPESLAQRPGIRLAFRAGIRCSMAVPLISRDAVIGGLHFHSLTPGAYTEQDLPLAERIGNQIAGALDNAQLFHNFSRMARSLGESEARFRAIFEQAALGVAELDIATGRFLAVNRRFCEIVGRSQEELLATTRQAITPPEDLELPGPGGRDEPLSLVRRCLRKDGGTLWLNITLSPLGKPGEKPGRELAMVRDVTEDRRAEAEMKSLQERLQRAEKMEALGTLAGGVAHDLNNFLGIIVGYAELLLHQAGAASPLRPRIQHIMSGGQRAAAIVQDLLTLARRGVSHRQVVNLNRLILECRELPEYRALASSRPDIEIRSDLEPDLMNLSGSPVHLGKSLFNLISNAAEAMPRGGTVTIGTANRYLDRPLRGYDEIREGDYVVLSVADTGEGIAEADLKRIFEPFYTRKVMGRSGTGLGLSVVWGTVKDHQGYVNVESRQGRGSTFTLYFPVTREAVAAAGAVIPPARYAGRGESVLVVDDVAGQRELTAEMLRSLHYDVAVAASGEEALAYLKEHRVDLLVLDMIMEPGIDGLETYRRVLELYPGQRAVIVSGFSETERVNAAQALGAGPYVRKPYVIEKIGTAVRSELDRKSGPPGDGLSEGSGA